MDRNEFLALLKDAGLRDVDRPRARRRQDRKCSRRARAREPTTWPSPSRGRRARAT